MKTITIFPNPKKQINFHKLSPLFVLLDKHQCKTFLSEQYFEKTQAFSGIEYCDDEKMKTVLDQTDMILVLGGDGSILEVSHFAAVKGIPILGVNLGRIGYMAELEIHELDMIEQIILEEIPVKIEERIMLDISIVRNGEKVYHREPTLNDVVLSNGPVSRLLSFDLYCDGELVGHYRADGMIVATPTGSTAYSMSAGGPILDPCLDCFCLTPICSHSLTSRPLVCQGSAEIELKNIHCRDNSKYLAIDGKESVLILDEDTIKIQRSVYKTKLLRVKDRGFLNVLRRKMSES